MPDSAHQMADWLSGKILPVNDQALSRNRNEMYMSEHAWLFGKREAYSYQWKNSVSRKKTIYSKSKLHCYSSLDV